MIWRAAAGAAALACALAAAAHDTPQAPAWQLHAHSSRHSDALRLADLDRDDWAAVAPRSGRNLTYVDEAVRLSLRQGPWTWALVGRTQATLVAGDEALQLAADVDAGRRPAADLDVQVDVLLRGFSGAGLALGRGHALGGGWRAEGEVQLLSLSRWLERRLQGPVQYRAATGTYEFALQSAELDNRLDFPFRQGFASRGAALLLSAGLAWEGESAWAHGELRDGGWLRWRGVPEQDATLNTATQAVDADGFLIYQPLIEGRNSQARRQRVWPWRATLAAGLNHGGQRWGVEATHVPDFGWLPALRWDAGAGGAARFGARWLVHEQRLVLQAGWRGFSASAGADRLGGSARSRELALAYAGTF